MVTSKVAVVGAGSWGTVLAALLAGGAVPRPNEGGPDMAAAAQPHVVLVARRPELAEQVRQRGRNVGYLPDLELPPALEVTAQLGPAVEGAGLVVMAVPSAWARRAMEEVAAHRAENAVLLSVSKGLEPGTLFTMSQVAAEVVPGAVVAVLSGPNFAAEVGRGLPAATVVACAQGKTAVALQTLMSSARLRVYTNDDVIGCELAGAVKNVLALAAGMVEGLGAGDNARAAMMTRGLAEMVRLGVAMGGHPLTFSGLAGLGDLVLTCTGEDSRNRRVGLALGQGRLLREILGSTSQVAEGVSSAAPVVALAERHGLEMPICSQVAAVLAGESGPAEAMGALLGREPTHELAGAPTWPGWARS